LSQLPAWLRLLAYATPLWHGVDLCRMLSLGSGVRVDLPLALINVAYLAVLAGIGVWAGARTYRRRLYV
jgi:lipooligosaccharide transport system permease protein